MVYLQHKILRQWFPELSGWLNTVPDRRKFYKYSMASILMQGIFMFLCQGDSRNQMNNRAGFGQFLKSNFRRLFPEMAWAHFDTVDEVLRSLKMEEVEKVKTRMIKSLITAKRITTMYGHCLIAVDATGITTYDEDWSGELLHRKTPGGKKLYLNYILEAKIVTPEGLSLSIGSEPLSNAGREQYEKQDCELKAFARLSAKLKKAYPRLPICLLMDGLYANKPVFDICEAYGWRYMITLKDTCLPNLQQSIADTEESARKRFNREVIVNPGQHHKQYGTATYQWITGLQHMDHPINWLECRWPGIVTPKGNIPIRRFTYVTNLSLRKGHPYEEEVLAKMAACGRLRWKIENEGFNCQKNQGYHLHHKYSRSSVKTLHVYYMLLQIAHLLHQLAAHTREVTALLKNHPKLSLKYLWRMMCSILEMAPLSPDRLTDNEKRCQIRLE